MAREDMVGLTLLVMAVLVALWASWPPRGSQRGWLALALGVLWAALVIVGQLRGVLPGFMPWLVALSFIGALACLLVLWSLAFLLARRNLS